VLAMYVQHAGLVIFGDASYRDNLPTGSDSSRQKKKYFLVWYGSPLVFGCEEHCQD